MTTPARRQYLRIKKEHEDAILLFRMGDFYETFDDDARLVARELEIALTSREMGRGQRVPLAGIPYHSLEPYLARLIKRGHKVAICEQTSDPAQSKGLVDREVVRVVTAGTVVEDALLEGGANNYLAAVVVDEQRAGLAYVDITTSEFAVSEFPLTHLDVELARLTPSELLAPERQEPPPAPNDTRVTPLEADAFDLEWATETLLGHFGVASLEAYGCDNLPLAVRAAGAIVDYLGRHHGASLSQVTGLYTYSTDAYMVLDAQTRRNLELFEGGRWGDRSASLLSVLDRTRTSMGGRLLRRWVGQPLLDVGLLEKRLDAVEWFHRSALRRARVISVLDRVSDIERLVNRVRGGVATPRDLVALAASVEAAPQLREIMAEDDDATPGRMAGGADRGQRGGLGLGPPGDSRRPAADRRRRRRDPGRLLAGARRAAGLLAGGAGLHRVAGADGARAHRDQEPEGRLQQGLRILHRDQQGQPRPRARGVRPAPDARRRRALHHPGDEGVRVARHERPGARRRAGGVAVQAGVRPARRLRGGRPPDRGSGGPVGRLLQPGGGGGPARLRPARAGRRRLSGDRRGASPGRRADAAAGLVRAQRHEDVERRRAAHRADRAEHGGQVDLHQAGRAHNADGPDRQLRTGDVRVDRPGPTGYSRGWDCRTTWR